jgi:hypothetical protein
MVTPEVPVRFVPVIVTFVPTGPEAGVNDVIVGGKGITVKFAALGAVPPAVVTPILPVVAPAGTVAFSEAAETAVTAAAATPLNLIDEPAVKFVPAIITTVPGVPEAGVNDVTVGAGGVTVKAPKVVAVSPAVVTAIVPEVVPAATTAVTEVGDATVTEAAATPLIFTELVPVRLVPVIVIFVPIDPEAGANEESVAGTTKFDAEAAAPPPVFTLILPVVAPAGTIALTDNGEITVTDVAGAPLNVTDDAPARLEPVIVTLVPTAPDAGVKEVIAGAGNGTS